MNDNLPKYVEPVTNRVGKLYHYFRYKGKRLGSLPGLPQSTEFKKAYYDFLASVEGKAPLPAKPTRAKQKPQQAAPDLSRTFGGVIRSYRQSRDYSNLKEGSTKTVRSNILKRIETSPWASADMATMKPKNVRVFLDDMTSGPAAWNNLLKILRVLINHAIEQEVMDRNPTLGIKKNAEGHRRAWTDAERAQFEVRWPVGTRQRLAYTIALYTGQRRGDIAAMTWDNVISIIERDYLHVVQEKTGTEVDLPIAGLLGAFAGEDRNGYWIKNTVTGGRLTKESFGNWFGDAIAAAGLPKKQGGCTLHGLRATTATHLANSGAAAHEIMSVTGHKSLTEAQRYTKSASQRKLVDGAMEKMANFIRFEPAKNANTFVQHETNATQTIEK